MKTIKVSEATNLQLNWLAIKCEGADSVASVYLADDDTLLYLDEAFYPTWEPTINWGQGGPMIERFGIMFQSAAEDGLLLAYFKSTGTSGVTGKGPDHLVAAVRCIVTREMGEKVYVPEWLE